MRRGSRSRSPRRPTSNGISTVITIASQAKHQRPDQRTAIWAQETEQPPESGHDLDYTK